MRAEKGRWRSPQLGSGATLELAQGELDYFEAGDGPPLVFVHGALVNANLWRRIVPALRSRHRCIALDLPLGAHLKPMPKDADLSPGGFADLIGDAIESLGLDDVTLVGNDSGGALSQLVATRRPERLGRLVLTSCEAFDNFPPKSVRPFVPMMRMPGMLWMVLAPLRMPAIRHRSAKLMGLSKRVIGPEAVDSYTYPGLKDGGVRRDLKKAMGGMAPSFTIEAAERFPEFVQPVLIAWSREDKFFPGKHAERLAQAFPDARREWIEDARTLSPEDQPERVAELLAEFAAASGGAASSPEAESA